MRRDVPEEEHAQQNSESVPYLFQRCDVAHEAFALAAQRIALGLRGVVRARHLAQLRLDQRQLRERGVVLLQLALQRLGLCLCPLQLHHELLTPLHRAPLRHQRPRPVFAAFST